MLNGQYGKGMVINNWKVIGESGMGGLGGSRAFGPLGTPIRLETLIERFHSRGQHLCTFIGTKESVCIRKEFNSHRTGLGHQHGRRFIVLGHQYGRRDVL